MYYDGIKIVKKQHEPFVTLNISNSHGWVSKAMINKHRDEMERLKRIVIGEEMPKIKEIIESRKRYIL